MLRLFVPCYCTFLLNDYLLSWRFSLGVVCRLAMLGELLEMHLFSAWFYVFPPFLVAFRYEDIVERSQRLKGGYAHVNTALELWNVANAHSNAHQVSLSYFLPEFWFTLYTLIVCIVYDRKQHLVLLWWLKCLMYSLWQKM